MSKDHRRTASRKTISGLTVSNLTALSQFAVICRKAVLIDASSSGFLLHLNRQDLLPKNLRDNLHLKSIEGEHVMLRISEMNLEIDGVITRTRMIGRGIFEVAIDFSADAPEYWRQCLMDLMPSPDEVDE